MFFAIEFFNAQKVPTEKRFSKIFNVLTSGLNKRANKRAQPKVKAKTVIKTIGSTAMFATTPEERMPFCLNINEI